MDQFEGYAQGFIDFLGRPDLEIELNGLNVLNIGCGANTVVHALEEKGATGWICDPANSAKEAAIAKGLSEERVLSVPFQEIPDEFDGHFDIILSTGLIDLLRLRDRRQFPVDVHRLTKEDGVAIIGLPTQLGVRNLRNADRERKKIDRLANKRQSKEMDRYNLAITKVFGQFYDSAEIVNKGSSIQKLMAPKSDRRIDAMGAEELGRSLRETVESLELMMGAFTGQGNQFQMHNSGGIAIAKGPKSIEQVPDINGVKLPVPGRSR